MAAGKESMLFALEERVVPVLKAKGFQGSFPHFRRILSREIHLLSFQFDRCGGGFVIEAASCPLKGHTHAWGEYVPPEKVTAHDLHPDERIRLQDGKWFRYDESCTCEEIASEVLHRLSEAEEFWRNKVLVK
ncbi:DUF4304 domain-containing protein [Peribacillus deserti]|uniref:DUF4304 domain-containing protein n=1 Tax=Peribacillus deserti TaxID=673318 RepID=A0A2N5M3F8_9BACI|nr:DUF4304 domain-containing protein [Peribacillus deserti]PLT28872.1 hypothetical protein CUU66_16115 [Peribacillus deserti]